MDTPLEKCIHLETMATGFLQPTFILHIEGRSIHCCIDCTDNYRYYKKIPPTQPLPQLKTSKKKGGRSK